MKPLHGLLVEGDRRTRLKASFDAGEIFSGLLNGYAAEWCSFTPHKVIALLAKNPTSFFNTVRDP